MHRYFIVLLTIFLSMFSRPQAFAQARCEILGMEHFGGDIADAPNGKVTVHEDQSFSFWINSNSTTSTSLYTGCLLSSRVVYRRYSASYGTLLSESCVPEGSNVDNPFAVLPQANGDTLLVGTSDQNVAVERRSGATIVYSHVYGGGGSEAIKSVQQAADGSIYILCNTNSSNGDVGFHYGSQFSFDTWLLKLDTAGNKVWGRVLGGTGEDLSASLQLADEEGCYVFGVTSSTDHDCQGNHGLTDLWIVRVDTAGQKQGVWCLGGTGDDGSGYDNGIFTLKDGSGGFYVLNRTASTDGDIQQRMPNEADFWLLHIDSAANIIWENTFGGPDGQYPTGLVRAADGSFWMGGFSNGDKTGGHISEDFINTDGWVVHADSLGQFVNQRTIGGGAEDWIRVLHALPDGTVLAAGLYVPLANSSCSPGFPQTSEGGHDAFIARLGPQSVGLRGAQQPEPAWSVYPNPAGNQIGVKVDGSQETFMLKLCDMQGRLLQRREIEGEAMLPTETLPRGPYLLYLCNEEGCSRAKKIILE